MCSWNDRWVYCSWHVAVFCSDGLTSWGHCVWSFIQPAWKSDASVCGHKTVEKDCRARGLNTEDAMCRSRWRKQIGMIDDHDECSGWMFLLVPAHPGCPGQFPQSRKTVVCVCVFVAIEGQVTICPSVLHAINRAFKLHYLINIAYNTRAEHVWQLLQKGIYMIHDQPQLMRASASWLRSLSVSSKQCPWQHYCSLLMTWWQFLADRTIGRAFGTLFRLSVCRRLSVICLWRFVLWQNGAS